MSEESNGGVRIGAREIYDKLLTVERQQDHLASEVRELRRDFKAVVIADHGKRIGRLELKFYGVLAGLIGAVAFLAIGGPK